MMIPSVGLVREPNHSHSQSSPIPSERTPVQEFETLKQMIQEAEEDIHKAEGGNKAAGTRARKTMQDIKNLAQDIRKKILELRTDGE
jgi:predicted metalloendopeptidase